MSRRTTAYRRVADSLREQILDGSLKPGEKIGSLTELQEQFGVSDTVILEARKVLVAEGLLQPRSGDGTYVRKRPEPQRLIHREDVDPDAPAFQLERGDGGLFPDIDDEQSTVPAPPPVAARLGVAAGEDVELRVRLYRSDGSPVQLVTTYAVPGAGPVEALAEEEITSRPALDAEARALGGVAGHLVTSVVRVEHGSAGPARMVETVVLAERYTLVYRPRGRARRGHSRRQPA
ncbi:GntR family transcriptional regulator [Streptomyces ipomoeae]|uniref:GntR family transcriptional regulator n=1 Tax=Streptomyces ipomoeae TaxID=103232 RepID=UPI00114642B1|nr:GntR family transcriptional regulator [Streptomyces ipomoeae]TQE33078.1 GntR family transcriptional regulator [Streptomyces ipomoeae]